MAICSSCAVCMKNCPTGAKWLPKSAHNCLYDCLLCQKICPQNKDYINNIIGPIEFDEAETEALLSGKSIKELPNALKKKVVFLGMDQWFSAIPRNIMVLMENVKY